MAAKKTSCNPPMFGLGLWKVPIDICADLVYDSIKLGVRHLDCACDYGNELQVGAGITRAIGEGIVTRGDLFITSKLWNTYHRKEHVLLAAKRSLNDLNIQYFDLYLVHFPISMRFVPFEVRYPPSWVFDPTMAHPAIELDRVPFTETWTAMEELSTLGVAKNIGVCNMSASLLMDLLSYCIIKPAVNQIELHPRNTQRALVSFCQSKGIHVTGFSPLGSPSYIELNMDKGEGVGLLTNPLLIGIAASHSRSTAQVMLRWNVQRGVSVVSKSTKIARIEENKNIFDFTLTAREMESIESLNLNQRYNDPGEFCKGMGGAIPIYA